MARRSRLTKTSLKKSKQNLILSILGIAIVLFLLFRYGVPLLSDLSFFAGNVIPSKDNVNDVVTKDTYVPPPSIDSLPKSTREKNVKITGNSLAGLTIKLYLNGSLEDEEEVGADGTFEFSINLTTGENLVKVKAYSGKLESEFSDTVSTSFTNEGPEIKIEAPKESETVHINPFNVTGSAEGASTVTINGFQAILSGRNYLYALTLKDGENEIKIEAVDDAGNKSEKTYKFNYSQ